MLSGLTAAVEDVEPTCPICINKYENRAGSRCMIVCSSGHSVCDGCMEDMQSGHQIAIMDHEEEDPGGDAPELLCPICNDPVFERHDFVRNRMGERAATVCTEFEKIKNELFPPVKKLNDLEAALRTTRAELWETSERLIRVTDERNSLASDFHGMACDYVRQTIGIVRTTGDFHWKNAAPLLPDSRKRPRDPSAGGPTDSSN